MGSIAYFLNNSYYFCARKRIIIHCIMVKAKASRLDTIKLIISSRDISSQDEILVELNEAGYEVTQATLSRDLKKLKVAKASTALRPISIFCSAERGVEPSSVG